MVVPKVVNSVCVAMVSEATSERVVSMTDVLVSAGTTTGPCGVLAKTEAKVRLVDAVALVELLALPESPFLSTANKMTSAMHKATKISNMEGISHGGLRTSVVCLSSTESNGFGAVLGERKV